MESLCELQENKDKVWKSGHEQNENISKERETASENKQRFWG